MSQHPHSLKARLFLASALLLPLFLGLTGLTLEQAFHRSLSAAAQERLQGHVYLLFSVAELEGESESARLSMPSSLLEPDFEQLNSGLYAYLSRPGQAAFWRSNSAQLIPEPPSIRAFPETPGELYIEETHLDERDYWQTDYGVIWEDEAGEEHPFQLTLLKDQSSYQAELASYRRQLWRWLGAATLVLLVAQSLILRWGLRPLDTLARALEAMRRGETTHITGAHPSELQPVVNNLNQVLRREQSLRQRYRDSLSNLAHSLKTPLAVLRGRVAEGDKAPHSQSDANLHNVIVEQVTRMDQVVNYQLRRAVSNQQQGLRQNVPLAPALERLKRTLDKVYHDKDITSNFLIEADLTFPGDEQDLLEVLGNLLDNAYKYGNSRVQVTAAQIPGTLYVKVEDDGPGIPSEKRQQAKERGQRLDSLLPGQGIGLAVTEDIVQSYDGQLKILESDWGGTRIEVRFPC